MKKLFPIFGILLVFLYATSARSAASLYQPGFRTVGAWQEKNMQRMEINIWYPCRRAPHDLNYSPWIISASANAKPAEGVFPLLVLSHATPANRFSYHELAARLARHGYIVVAPTHLRDSMQNMDDMFSWLQITHRIEEIEAALQLVREEKDLKNSIGKLGFIGFGAGGATGLIMCGATPDCQSWPDYCKKAEKRDPYCTRKARSRIDEMCANLPVLQHMEVFGAIACIAPAYGMLFATSSFASFRIPVLIVSAGRDIFGRPELHSEPLARFLGKKALYLDLPIADVGALMSQCPPQLQEELPELCGSVSKETRSRLQSALENSLLAFFNSRLK